MKELTSKNTKKKESGCIKDKNGNILFKQEEIAAIWVEYITELYEDHREQMPKFEVTSGASVMKEEIQKALKSMKDGKATGTDELPAEALKALDEHNIEIITSLCHIIYNSGMIPTEIKHSVFITLPKWFCECVSYHLHCAAIGDLNNLAACQFTNKMVSYINVLDSWPWQ